MIFLSICGGVSIFHVMHEVSDAPEVVVERLVGKKQQAGL